MDLLRGRPALRLDFRVSLALDLMHAIGLVLQAPTLEGLDQWVYATVAALPPTLKEDLEQVMALTRKSDILEKRLFQLSPEDPVHHDFAAFVAWLNDLRAEDYRHVVEDTLRHFTHHAEEQGLEPPRPENLEPLHEILDAELGDESVVRIIYLAQHPLELKAQHISVLTRFWEQFYRSQYAECRALMERSVAHHLQQAYGSDFFAVFSAVTGRRFPREHDEKERLAEAEQVIFVPSCHIGPYVTFSWWDEQLFTVIVYFNCRPTGAPEGRVHEAPSVQDLFPPVKALADETRLQILAILNGRRLYAQEIVDQLEISQSAVSRHLRLMVAGGLLNVDKQDSMKFYSINEETLAALAERLRRFRGGQS
jgi:DNA-binding transcriptional ArsR family regulator